MSLSTFLDGREPGRLRGLVWLALSEVGQRGTATVTSDAGGGGTTAWSFAGTVPCRIDPLSAGTGMTLAGRIDERSTHLVTVPAGVTVTSNDRFGIAGRGTFEVTATRDQTSRATVEFEVLQIL